MLPSHKSLDAFLGFIVWWSIPLKYHCIYIHVGIIGFGSFHNAYSWLQETYHPWNDSDKEAFAGKFSNSVCIKSKASIYGVATCSLHVPKESTQNSRKVNVSRTKVCCYLSSGSVTQVWFHQLGGPSVTIWWLFAGNIGIFVSKRDWKDS